MKYPLTDEAKELARLLVQGWDAGEVEQRLTITVFSGDGKTEPGFVIGAKSGFESPPFAVWRELGKFELIDVDPGNEKWEIWLLQSLRDAVESNFAPPSNQTTTTTDNSELGKTPPSNDEVTTIYLSHRRVGGRTLPIVDELKKRLREHGYSVVLGTGRLSSNSDWVETARERILNSDVFCVVISENTADSSWIQQEIQWAQEAGLTVLPIALDSVPDIYISLGRLHLDQVQYIFYDGTSESFSPILGIIQDLARLALKRVRKQPQRKIILNREESLPDYTLFKADDKAPKPLVNEIFGNPASDVQYQCDVFVIMPFREPFETIYTGHIKPVAANYKLTIKRGDDFFSAGSIMRDVWSGMFSSYVVIAECTGRNPNVFYELGMAHSLNKPGILLTQNVDDIPFDIRHLRYIKYDDTAEGREQLQHNLEVALVKLLFGEDIE